MAQKTCFCDTNYASIVAFSGSAISNVIQNFKGAKGVAMATIFVQKVPKLNET